MSIKVITFDFWGTLYHNRVSLGEERKDRIMKQLSDSGISGITGEMIHTAMKKVWDHWDDVWKRETRTIDVEEWLVLVLAELDVELPQEVQKELSEELQQAIFTGNTQTVAWVKEAVCDLKKKYNIGIISDTGIASGRYLRKLLNKDALDFFDLYLFSDEFGKSKPAKELFSAVLDHFGVEPEEVVHIGDLRHTDVTGAKNAGMHTIRYAGIRDDKDENYAEADYVIDNYRELPALVAGIA